MLATSTTATIISIPSVYNMLSLFHFYQNPFLNPVYLSSYALTPSLFPENNKDYQTVISTGNVLVYISLVSTGAFDTVVHFKYNIFSLSLVTPLFW